MFIYISVIIILFILSYTKRVTKVERLLYVLLAVFLCFGYMCGSDWRNYESEFYSGFIYRAVEPGYMFVSNWLNDRGIDFWYFHTFTKVFCWILFLYTFKKMWPSKSLGFPLMLFMASFGFFLFIDCPFRNLISVAIFLFFIPYLEQKRKIIYILGVLLASSFHLSAFFFLVVPFIIGFIDRCSNRALVVIYFSVFVTLLLGIDQILINIVLAPVPFLQSKILAYSDTDLVQGGGLFSMGLILRLICLWGMLHFRERLYAEGKQLLFALCYIYLLLSLLSYSVPILFRIPLFLSPFFVLMVSEIVDHLGVKMRRYAKLFYLLVALTITTKTSSSVFYVPYTNIIPYWIKDKPIDYNQRSEHNIFSSPYSRR